LVGRAASESGRYNFEEKARPHMQHRDVGHPLQDSAADVVRS
jgi:hypothetical protein